MTSKAKTGFCIPYTVRDTADKGLGVFADATISKGAVVWRHLSGQYAVYDERSLREFLASLSKTEVAYELEHMFGLPEFPGYEIRVYDDGVLINHSRKPTLALNNDAGGGETPYESSAQTIEEVTNELLNDRFALIATRDLKASEELTQDYSIGVEDPPYYDTLCEQYDVSWRWL